MAKTKRRDPLTVRAKPKFKHEPKTCSLCDRKAWYHVRREGFCRNHHWEAKLAAAKANGVGRQWII